MNYMKISHILRFSKIIKLQLSHVLALTRSIYVFAFGKVFDEVELRFNTV